MTPHATAARPQGPRNPVLLGIVITAAAVTMFPLGDAISKLIMPRIGPIEIVWARYLWQLAVLLPLAAARPGLRLLHTRRPVLQIVRGVAIAGSSMCLIASYMFIPLVDALSVMFLGPLLAVTLAARFLGERVGWHRWAAALVGFGAVLLIMRPGLGVVHWGASFAVLAAFANAAQLMIGRRLAGSDGAAATFTWSALVGLLFGSLLVPFVWVTPTLREWLMLGAAGGFLALAQLGAVTALNYAPVSAVAPYNYTMILAALAVGWLVFGELPDRWSGAGAVILVLAGLYAFSRERAARVT